MNSTSKKNSVTAFKKKPTPILETAPVPTADTLAEAVQSPKRKQGRPLKGAVKRSHKVMLAFTPAEGEVSRDQAGDVPEATYIYKFLKDNGYFDQGK